MYDPLVLVVAGENTLHASINHASAGKCSYSSDTTMNPYGDKQLIGN